MPLTQEKSKAAEDKSSLESDKQIAVILIAALPPPPDNQTPPHPHTSPALLLHSALISRHFESFSHCIFYHFFLRLALSYASAPFKIQSQKTRQLAPWILSPVLSLIPLWTGLLERAHLTEEFHTVLEKCIFSHL